MILCFNPRYPVKLGEGIRVFTSLEAAEGFKAKQEIINLE